MTQAKAIRFIAARAVENAAGKAARDRIEVYLALSLVMPTKQERTEAERAAWSLEEAEKQQLKFQSFLQSAAIGDGGDGQ